ncbi:kinase-like domain-containing protein [Pholiota molesta]|nr:kinase-like domain-containing protein [Pholiota molesta]
MPPEPCSLPLPANVLLGILASLYALCVHSLNNDSDGKHGADGRPQHHYCSLHSPCAAALKAFQPIYVLKRVSRQCNRAVLSFQAQEKYRFVERVEDVYYPNARHINAKIRAAVLFERYRVFKTIDTECGDRGVFEAYDYGHPEGCAAGTAVIVKAWLDPEDGECVMESRVYASLTSHAVDGVPALRQCRYDAKCEVYALVLEKLGPSLQDLLNLLPTRKFSTKMVLALAIQMINRYEALHNLGIIHNGVKPGNICLSSSPDRSSQLNLIDFGLSYFNDNEDTPLPSDLRYDPVGNRQFLSIHGHLGITQSQRDDLESLGYLFSFLYHGHLPWSAATLHPLPTPHPTATGAANKHKTSRSTAHIWQIKIATPASLLFRDMPPAFLHFWRDVKGTAFGERPGYERLRAYFVQAWKAEALDLDLDLDPEPEWRAGAGVGEEAEGGAPGEVDWVGIYERLQVQEEARKGEEEARFRRMLLGANGARR